MSTKKSPKHQISIKRSTYDQLKAYAERQNLSISTVVERAIAPTLGQELPPPRPMRRYRGPRT